MDFGPNNWYPEPVPTWNLQTPTIFVPPSPTLVNPTLSPPPHGSPHFIPPFQSPSIPAFIPNPAAVQIIDAFAEFRQTMDECFNDFRADIGKVQERLRERGRLIKELRSKVSSVATTPGPRYAPEDPTLPRPWRGLIDGSTGSLYYWNPATHQTQYERPCEQAWITQPEDVSWDDSAKVLISTSDGSCSHSDLSYQTHSNASDATNVEIAISNVVGLHKPEAVDIHGFISEEISLASPNPNSDDNVVAGGTITDVALGSAPLLDHELVSLNASAAMVSNVSHHLSTVISESTLSSTNGSVLGSATTPKKFKTVPVHHHLKTRSNIKMKRQPLSKPARRSRTRIGGDSETTKYGPPSLIMSTKADDLDVHDDPSMELAFYPQTLTGTTMAFEKLQSMRLSFRPEDYYAEMVKSASELENMKCQLSVQMTTNQRPASLSQVFTKWNLVFQAFRGHSVSNLFGLYHHCLNGKVGQEKWPPDEWIEKMKWDVNNLFDWLNSTISEFGTVATLNAWLHDMFMCQPLEYRLENINLFLVIMMKSQSTDVGNSIVQLLGGILEPAMFWVIYTTHGQMHKTKFFSSKQGLLDIDYTYQTTINKPPASMKGWPHETFRNPWRKRTTNVRYFIEFLEIGCYYESAIMLTSPAWDIVRLISAKYLVADLSKTLGCMLFIRTLLHMFMDESHASGEPSEFYPATVDIALAMIIVSFAFLFAVLHVCYKFHGCHSTEKDLRSRKNGRDDSIFQKGSGKLLSILVAGDVASRELDLFHVTTYDFPKGIHDSVHTFGRAGMVVKLIKESMKEIPDWLNDDATQSLSYGGEHSQWYGSNDFGNFALIPPTHFPLPLTNDALFLIFFMRLIYLQLITFVISRPMHLTSPGINFGIPKIIKHCVMADFNWRFQEKIIFQNNRSISTGYAREYRARLLRKWGIVYVTACCGCASYLVKSGNVDGKRLYITVGSASPYTSSAILVLRELFRARAPLSGVANFNMFRAETCSLESHYMDNHVDDDNNFFVLSPINLGVQCSCPMILFQGQEDKIVPEFFFLRAFRVADHCPLGIFVLNSINQLVFLKFMNQGLERKYGAVYRGNSCSHVRCSLYFVDFMSTWLIENGFVAIDYGDLALLPHTSFSVPMRSREAFMLILFSTLMHSQLIGIGISVYLLPGVNGEALRVFSNVQTQYCWQSIPNSHVSVHPCALIHNCQVTTADGIAIGATLIDITSDAIHGDSRSFTYQVIEGPAEQMPLLLRIWTACASVETKFFHYFQLFLTYVSGVKVSQGAVFVFVCGDQGAHALITYSEVTNGYTISTVDLLYIINRADTVGMHDFSRAGQFGNNRVWVNDTTCFSRQMGNLEAHFLSEKKVIHQSVTSDLKKGTTETGRQQTVSCVTDADLLLRFLLLTLTEEKSKLLILVYYYPCQLTSYCLLFFRFALGKWMHEVDWMINTVQWNGFYCSNLGTVKA